MFIELCEYMNLRDVWKQMGEWITEKNAWESRKMRGSW